MTLPSERLRNASHQADTLLRESSLDANGWRQFQICLADIANQMAAIERSCSPMRRGTVIAFRRSVQPVPGPHSGGGDAA